MEVTRYICISMSPAIDATVSLSCAPKGEGEIYKVAPSEGNVGGKGVNVARWLALRGADVVVGGLLGTDNAILFEREFAKYGIADRCIRVPGATRNNEMIVWPGGGFKVNRESFPSLAANQLPSPAEVLGAAGVTAGDLVVLSGSLPAHASKSYYADCIALCREKGARVVLDASGEALRLGFAAGPDVIKPNAEECAALVGFVPCADEDFKRATSMLKGRVAFPIISDGSNGCWFDGAHVQAPEIEVVDPTAAGDTLLAEWCFSGDSSRAVAAGAAACLMRGSEPPSLECVNIEWLEE